MKNETILNIGKNGLHAKAIAFAKSSVWVQKKIAQNIRKTIVQAHYSYCMQKSASKNTRHSKNETIFNVGKNGLHAKAIALAKSSVWVKK